MTTGLSSELRNRALGVVCSREQLNKCGITDSAISANLDARRWQRIGRAYVLHNGPLNRFQRWEAALTCAGPRAVLTSFTALESHGLRHWERIPVHLLIGAGARAPKVPGIDVRVHRTTQWAAAVTDGGRHRVSFAATLAASSLDSARPAVGLMAAVVQQRLARASDLNDAALAAPRLRHRRALLLGLADIEMGSHSLSEIDFVTLCRRAGLPPPERQAVRVEPSGRRRYLDAFWRRSDGSTLAVEVDGALHLTQRSWWSDQLRQNRLALAGAMVLRFPSVIVREEPLLVVSQLREGLGL